MASANARLDNNDERLRVLDKVFAATIYKVQATLRNTEQFKCDLFTDHSDQFPSTTLNIVRHIECDVTQVYNCNSLLFILHGNLSSDSEVKIQLYNNAHIADIYGNEVRTSDLSRRFKTTLNRQIAHTFDLVCLNENLIYSRFNIITNRPLDHPDLFKVIFGENKDNRTKVIFLSVALRTFISEHLDTACNPPVCPAQAVAPIPWNSLEGISQFDDAMFITPERTGPLSLYTITRPDIPESHCLKVFVVRNADGATSTAHIVDGMNNVVFMIESLRGAQTNRVTRSGNEVVGYIGNNLIYDGARNAILQMVPEISETESPIVTYHLRSADRQQLAHAMITPNLNTDVTVAYDPTNSLEMRALSIACAIKIIIERYGWYIPNVVGAFST